MAGDGSIVDCGQDSIKFSLRLSDSPVITISWFTITTEPVASFRMNESEIQISIYNLVKSFTKLITIV